MNKSLRIGIDARPLAFPGNGNARYLYSMLKSLMQHRPDDEWVLLTHRPPHPEFIDLLQRKQVILDVNRSLWTRPGPIWMHFRVPQLLKEYDCDLFWATLSLLPYNYNKRCKPLAIVNFHDLNAFKAPETMVLWNKWQHRLLDKHTLQNAQQVLCLSDNTRRDILEVFPDLPADNLPVVYPGCELPNVESAPPAGPVGRFSHFILSVGAIEPRKNYKTLLRAYRAARRTNPDLTPLVILGRKGWGDESIYNQLKSGELEDEGIYFLESAPDAALRWCYENASLLAFPSFHEGFGLPIVEALQLSRPLLLSDIRIFREIAPGALFVSPHSPDAWTGEFLSLDEHIKANALTAPEFDPDFWSWKKRSHILSEIINTAGRESRRITSG